MLGETAVITGSGEGNPEISPGSDAASEGQAAKGGGLPPDKSPVGTADEIEFDDEGPDGKPVKVKLDRQKAAERLARVSKQERQIAARHRELNDLWEKEAKPFQARVAQIKQNPMALYDLAKELGLDPEQVARAYAEDYVRRQEMTPEQRKAADLADENARYRTQMEERERADQEAAAKTEQEKYRVEAENKILAAHAKSGLPKHPMVLALMNGFAASQIRNGFPEPDFDLAAENVRDFAHDYMKSWVGGMKYEDLVKQMPDLVKMVREGDLKAATTGRNPPKNGNSKRIVQEKETITPEEWRRRFLSQQ